MKKMILFVVVFLLMGCMKQNSFDLPSGEITVGKNVSDIESCFGGVRYEPLIISDELEKKEIINHINNWRLVKDNNIYKPSCGHLYSISWENHNIDIYTITDINMGVVIDGKSYKVVDGNMDFIDELNFEEIIE